MNAQFHCPTFITHKMVCNAKKKKKKKKSFGVLICHFFIIIKKHKNILKKNINEMYE